MKIRHLRAGDLGSLLELYSHLHRKDAMLPTRSIIDSVWNEVMSNQNYRYYGGFSDDQLVSSCTLTIIPNLTRGCRPYGIVENVVTHADFRRRGYASSLLQQALGEAWSAGCYKVMLLTGRKDTETIRFYESVGFDRHRKQAFIAQPPE